MPKFLSLSLGLMAVCAATSVLAQTVELPTRKAGLWELRMSVAGGQLPGMTFQQCTDETIDKRMSTMFGPMQKDMCAKRDVQKTDNGYVIDSVCGTGEISMTSHAEISGDLNEGYTMKVASQTGGGPSGLSRNTTLMVAAKWIGACAADQRPGDIVMPGGMKINVKDLEKGRSFKVVPKPESPAAPE